MGTGATTAMTCELGAVHRVLVRHQQRFTDAYPDDTTADGSYPDRTEQAGQPAGSNVGWTTGFLPGMFWAIGEATGDEELLAAARAHVPSFAQRILDRIDVDHHDLGFLYTLATAPAWRRDRDPRAKAATLAAADQLMTRFLEPAGIIQAWGDLSDPAQRGRTIIDSLMNMPLLYWATEVTGDQRYRDAAVRHTVALRDHIVRADDSTHHTFHWDPATGEPLHGTTAQGYSDDSCWARGQAWGIYGFALGFLHTGDRSLLRTAERLADYFLAHLPNDRVAYWDLIFTDGSDEPRDSSAAAIAVCGLDDLAEATGRSEYREAADEILASLVATCATDGFGHNDCMLLHGVYHKLAGIGVDEGNLWGDYFYCEALARRADPTWVPYWHPLAEEAIK